jgi:hypothetical protein
VVTLRPFVYLARGMVCINLPGGKTMDFQLNSDVPGEKPE